MNRRRFLRNAAGVFVPMSFGIICKAQNFNYGSQLKLKAASGGGGTNNVALVGTNKGGAADGTQGSSRAFAMPSNVTNGNNVIFAASVYDNGNNAPAPTAGMLTKTAGTATVGTIQLAKASGSGTASHPTYGLWLVPITGSGSLTLTYNWGVAGLFSGVGAAEFSGLNASPLDATGSGGSYATTGSTPFTETSGSITTSGNGLIVSVISEANSTSNWTRTNSDTVIFNDSNATTDFSLVIQYRINNTTSNAAFTSTAQGASINYGEEHAAFKTS